MTVMEVLVATFILTLILGLLCAVFKTGVDAWKKSRTTIDVEDSVQVAVMRIANDLRQSSTSSITIYSLEKNNDIISFLSPCDDEGKSDFDMYGFTPLWVKYIIYYLARDPQNDSSDPDFKAYKILKKELVLEENYGTVPIQEVYDKNDLWYYMHNTDPHLSPPYPQEGRLIARNITDLEFYLSGDMLDFTVIGQKAGDNNSMIIRSSVFMRN